MKKILVALSTFLLVFFFLATDIQGNDFLKRFSLKFTGGYGTMSGGDMNKTLESHEDYFKRIAITPYKKKNGELRVLNRGFEYETELVIRVIEKFRLGIGVGYIQRNEPSIVYLEVDEPMVNQSHSERSYTPELSAIPIKLSAYYSFPIFSRMNLFVNGGIGYYFCKLKFYENIDSQALIWRLNLLIDQQIFDSEIDAKDNGIGFHGAIGLEYSIIRNVSFFIEGAGRQIRLKKWKGTHFIYNKVIQRDYADEEMTTSKPGSLWFYTERIYNLSQFEINVKKPSDNYLENVRNAEIDFSGLSIRIGFIVRL